VSAPPPVIKKSTRTKQAPSHLQDYICNAFHDSPNQSSGTSYPISNYISYSHLSNSQCRFSIVLVI
jgi:hypothetical protein